MARDGVASVIKIKYLSVYLTELVEVLFLVVVIHARWAHNNCITTIRGHDCDDYDDHITMLYDMMM